MNPSNSFAEAELERSAADDSFVEELQEFLKIMDNNDVDEEEFYRYLESEHEDEDWAISTSARNYSSHVSSDDDDDIIELANDLTELEFSDSDQDPTLQWQPEYTVVLARVSVEETFNLSSHQ
jgi:hypothetical protein